MKIKDYNINQIPSLIFRRLYLNSELVKKPSSVKEVVSDLFIWRLDRLFQTYFELLDIYGLISCDLEKSSERSSTFVFFDKNGTYLFEKKISGNDFARNTISITDLLNNSKLNIGHLGGYGTFAVFHSIDKPIGDESSLSDRGYCGYEFLESNFKGYVHGNFDAISRTEDKFEFLMGYGKLKRSYNLQHILTGPSTYELAIVNPTSEVQSIVVKFQSDRQKNMERYQLPLGGVRIVRIKVEKDELIKVKIISKQYMSRPTVFRYDPYSFDVFHG